MTYGALFGGRNFARFGKAFNRLVALLASMLLFIGNLTPASALESARMSENAINIGAYVDTTNIYLGNNYISDLPSALTVEPFFVKDAAGHLSANTSLGTAAVLTDTGSDFTVKYTLNALSTWSDGVAITAADLMVLYLTETKAATRALLGGYDTWFGSDFNTKTKSAPTVSSDGLSITFNFTDSNWDWENSIRLTKPAHILERRVNPSLTISQAKAQLISDAALNTAQTQLASAWNSIYNLSNQATLSAETKVASGPYRIESRDSGSLTFVKNANYRGSRTLNFETIKLVATADDTALLNLWSAGSIDVADTASQPNVADATYTEGWGICTEHFDIKVSNGATAYSHALAGSTQRARDLRRALLLSIPRETIAADLIYQPASSLPRTMIAERPSFDTYAATAEASNFDDVYAPAHPTRLAAAKAIVQSYYTSWNPSTGPLPIAVNVLWGSPSNTRRAAIFERIRVAAAQAGFALTNSSGTIGWQNNLSATDGVYNATFFSWCPVLPELDPSGQRIFDNFSSGAYTSQLNTYLTATSATAREDAKVALTNTLIDESVTLPLFHFPNRRMSARYLQVGAPSGDMALDLFTQDWLWSQPEIPVRGTFAMASGNSYKVGSTIALSSGNWTPGTTFSYDWFCSFGEGTSSSTYLIKPEDVDQTLCVRVTAELAGYAPSEVELWATQEVLPGDFPSNASISVSGSPAVGKMLIANSANYYEGTDFSYQWLKNGSEISGSTESDYVVKAADAGTKISVEVTATLDGYVDKTLTSNSVSIPLQKMPTTGTATLIGTFKIGKTIAVKLSKWTTGVSFKYTWLRNGKVIPGATKSTYKITTADKGKSLQLSITASKSGYNSVGAKSPAVKIK